VLFQDFYVTVIFASHNLIAQPFKTVNGKLDARIPHVQFLSSIKSKAMKAIFTFFLISCVGLHLQATNARIENLYSNGTDPLTVARTYIHSHLEEWGLAESDIADMTVSDRYTDKSSGITRIYFEQRYQGIPVDHAILNVCMTRDNKVYYSTCRFIPNLAS
jgi:hypothetical protein